MMKWQYKVDDVAYTDAEKTLNELGGAGWEVCGCDILATGHFRFVMKREDKSDKFIGV